MYLICICNFRPWGSNVFRKFTLGLVFWLNGWPSWYGNFLPPLQCQLRRLILDSENKILFPGTLAKFNPTLPLLSAALGKWWCELRESTGKALWNGRCSLAALSEIPEPRWGLSTLFNFLAVFQTCDLASGELWPVCPVQEKQWWQSRATKVGAHGTQGVSVLSLRRGAACGSAPFFTYPVQVIKEGKSRLVSEVCSKRIWGKSCDASKGNSGHI